LVGADCGGGATDPFEYFASHSYEAVLPENYCSGSAFVALESRPIEGCPTQSVD
jgi:hypothetical protein